MDIRQRAKNGVSAVIIPILFPRWGHVCVQIRNLSWAVSSQHVLLPLNILWLTQLLWYRCGWGSLSAVGLGLGVSVLVLSSQKMMQ